MFDERELFRIGGEWTSNGMYSSPPSTADLNAYYDRLGADLDAPPVAPATPLEAARVPTAHALQQTYCPAPAAIEAAEQRFGQRVFLGRATERPDEVPEYDPWGELRDRTKGDDQCGG